MMEKLKAVGAKLEVMLHTVLDWATAQIKRLDTPQEIAVAATLVMVAADAVTIGHFGVIKFLIGVGKEALELISTTAQSGGWVFVVCMLVCYLIVKEIRK